MPVAATAAEQRAWVAPRNRRGRREPGSSCSRARPSLRARRFRSTPLPVSIGRGGQNDIPLDGDEFSSARHARFERRRDGLWVEDAGSTNGTFVNGARVTTPRRLVAGDVVRVGQTDFRVEL